MSWANVYGQVLRDGGHGADVAKQERARHGNPYIVI